ncbi:uncharacterized protein TRIVIDRAFT_145043, partial [Trichoderma virens Gv29-8]
FNYIVKLPVLKEPIIKVKFNSIFIIVNRLIKITLFIPYIKGNTAEKLVYILQKYITVNHRLLKEIIFNRGSTFISKY